MSRKTLALVATAPNQPLSLQEIVLEDPRPDQAVVEIQAVGICHLELAILHGHLSQPFPIVLGHEGTSEIYSATLHEFFLLTDYLSECTGAGIVRDVGSEVTHVKPGDKVVVSFDFCTKCENCKEKLPGYCDEMQSRNWSGVRTDGTQGLKSVNERPIHGSFIGQSSFSRLALVNRQCLIKVAPESDLKLLAPLGCGIQTGTGVVLNTLNVRAGQSLVVSGCGAVGLSAIMAAKIRGAGTIIAIDLAEERLAVAKQLGATHAFNGRDKDLLEKIRALCPLPGGVRHAFDTTAVPSVIELLIQATGMRGRTVVVGATPPDQSVKIQPLDYLNQGKQFVGSVEGDSNPPEVSSSSCPY
jgi:aryl-alcohol dehydrogenase